MGCTEAEPGNRVQGDGESGNGVHGDGDSGDGLYGDGEDKHGVQRDGEPTDQLHGGLRAQGWNAWSWRAQWGMGGGKPRDGMCKDGEQRMRYKGWAAQVNGETENGVQGVQRAQGWDAWSWRAQGWDIQEWRAKDGMQKDGEPKMGCRGLESQG